MASARYTSTFLAMDSCPQAMVSAKSPDNTAFLVGDSLPFIVPVSVVQHLWTLSPSVFMAAAMIPAFTSPGIVARAPSFLLCSSLFRHLSRVVV